jgi:hypothetical protein
MLQKEQDQKEIIPQEEILHKKVSYLSLWKQFLPLSLSDVTMAIGDPLIHTTLAHLPESRMNIASLGVAKSQVVFFESPIIMLLHASNVCAPSKNARKILKKFMLLSITLLATLLFLLTLPPVYHTLSEYIFDIDQAVSSKARMILLFLILWPVLIGWRRYYQGILIRTHHEKEIGQASLSRIFVVAGVLLIGYFYKFPGFVISGTALILGIFSETFFITLAAKKYESDLEQLSHIPYKKLNELPHDMKSMWRFYWPLANSMIFVWGGRALLIGILARAQDSALALAAWPMSWGIVLLIANATRMVQQIIIRHRFKVEDSRLFIFALSVGSVFSFILLMMSGTPLGLAAVEKFVGHDLELLHKVAPVLFICSGIPFLVAIQNALQGILMSEGQTQKINYATWTGVGLMLTFSMLGIFAGYPGAHVAAISMLISLLSENIFLFISVRGC